MFCFKTSHILVVCITCRRIITLALKTQDIKTFQGNAGLGIYYKLDRNWALLFDWQHYYGTKFSANDDLASGQIIYRFGNGER